VPKFSQAIRDVLWGNQFGEVFPKRDDPPPATYDGRTAALKILKAYFRELTFYRPGGRDASGAQKAPIPFQIPDRDIHIEWPDDEADLHLPSLAFLSQGIADYDSIGLVSYVEENTVDHYAPGTVLIWMSEYVEKFSVEIWAETKAQRRSMLVGLEQALSPLEQMAGLRFHMPDYYEQLVCFELMTREVVDDDQAGFVRRKARMVIEMRFNVVSLVNIQDLRPSLSLTVDADDATGEPVSLTAAEDEPGTPEGG
jgi:hypothetical protein